MALLLALTLGGPASGSTYQEMGLLGSSRPTNFYDPGSFWSGDELELLRCAHLGAEMRIDI